MHGSLAAVHAKFQQLNRRTAVFDRNIREHVGTWQLSDPIPADEIIARFERSPEFSVDGSKVVLPLHEPDSAQLTGEFLLYYPDNIVPSIVYYDFVKDGLSRIPVSDFSGSYPAWRLRYWHPNYTPEHIPDHLHDFHQETGIVDTADQDLESESEPEPAIETLPDDEETLADELRSMVTASEIAEREDARKQCDRLPPKQFLTNRGGIEEVVVGGIDVDDYGQHVIHLRLPETDDSDTSVDIPDKYGIYPGAEVIVDSYDGLPGFPAEAKVVEISGRQIELSFYWDRGPKNPNLRAFELESDNRFLIGELLNPVPFDRRREAVDLVTKDDRKCGWLSGQTTIGFESLQQIPHSTFRLNDSQHEAVYQALCATDVFCIHGPPGTGKTRTLVEIVNAACQNGGRVLAVAHSNQAVDNLLVGDSTDDRVDPASIHGLVTTSDITAARAGTNSSNELVTSEYVGNDLYQSDVVCATMSGSHQFGADIFDIAVIDEATQASISASLIPVARAERIVLAGDHKQLPPYHSGEHSKSEDLAVSLFEQLLGNYGDDIVEMLTTQYRMNEQIIEFSNNQFYDGAITHGQHNRTWSFSSLPPFSGIHVEGEEQQAPSGSYYNETEAAVVAEEVDQLLSEGARPSDIGIITPYSGQIGKIRVALSTVCDYDTESVKIATVDSFQGSEREAIIVSFVRSNPQGYSGFLTFPNEGPRRLNVALTRGRRRCVLVGNFDTLRTRAPSKAPTESAAAVYQSLYEHLLSNGQLSNYDQSGN